MICREFEPSEPLRPYIKSYIVLEDPAGIIKGRRMSIYPSGYPELVISYGDTVTFEDSADFLLKAERGYLGGQISRPVHYRCSGSFKSLSIIFRPWGFYGLTGIPQGEFKEKRTDLEQILGRKMERCIEAICTAPGTEAKARAADSFFVRCFYASEIDERIVRLIHAANMIERSFGRLDLSDLADALNINIKTMERYFKNLAGITPKVFSRIVRFNKALNLLNSASMPPGDIAYSLGYFDQSHFINEIKQFTGRTPSIFPQQGDASINESFRELVLL